MTLTKFSRSHQHFVMLNFDHSLQKQNFVSTHYFLHGLMDFGNTLYIISLWHNIELIIPTIGQNPTKFSVWVPHVEQVCNSKTKFALGSWGGAKRFVCPSVCLSVMLSPPKPLDEIQPNFVCELFTWMGRATAHFLPVPLGPAEGQKRSNIIKFQLQSQFQRFLNQTLRVFSQMKVI